MPSSYINTDNIGNCYLNRVNGSVLLGEAIAFSSSSSSAGDVFREWLTVKFGDTRTIWTPSATSGSLGTVAIRFPVAWETLTGSIPTPDTFNNNVANLARCKFWLGRLGATLNTTNGTSNSSIGIGTITNCNNTVYCFAVINDYALAWCTFSSTARTSVSFGYQGWLRNDSGGSGGRYTGSQFPRNLCLIGINDAHSWTGSLSGNFMQRVITENLGAGTNLYSTNDTTFNPAINCVGDSTPLILRDAASPFYRVGMTYHLFRIPSSCTIGQIYKLGTDPDNSNKPYVICCGNWGSFKVGMRIWADGYN
jgi:hypothetical protein